MHIYMVEDLEDERIFYTEDCDSIVNGLINIGHDAMVYRAWIEEEIALDEMDTIGLCDKLEWYPIGVYKA